MNKLIIEKIKKIPLIRIFSITVVISFLLWGICLLVGDTNQANVFFFGQKPYDDLFMDFVNPIWQSTDFLSYEYLFANRIWFCYTPITYCFFNILDTITKNTNSTNPYFVKLLLSVFFLSLCSVSLVILNYSNLFKIKKFDKLLFSIAILCSGIYLHAFERANVILAVMLCIYYFIFNYRSKNKISKEIAILLLAIAAVLKISPMIFIWLLLIQKDFKSIFKFFVYFTMLLILPCLLFPRGIESLCYLYETLKLLADNNFSLNILGQGKFISNFILMFFTGINIHNANIINTTFYIFICGFCTIALLFQKKEWKRVLILTLVFFQLPNTDPIYILIYLIPAMVLYFNDNEKSKSDYLFLLWFILIFNTFQLYFGVIEPWIFREISIIAIFIQLFIESVKIFKLKYIFEWINKHVGLVKFFLDNPKQKRVLNQNITRYVSCSILSLIILASGFFAYYKNFTYDRYHVENIENTHYFETKPTTLKSGFQIDGTCIFSPKQIQTYENIFQTADSNDGIRMELSPAMTVSLIYPTQMQQLKGFSNNNIEPDNIYKIHFVITQKSVASIFYKFSTEQKLWLEVFNYTVKNQIKKDVIQKIIINSNFSNSKPLMSNVFSFDLKIKNGNSSNLIVLITLFAFLLPLIYAFYYKNFKKIFKKLYVR